MNPRRGTRRGRRAVAPTPAQVALRDAAIERLQDRARDGRPLELPGHTVRRAITENA